MIDNQDLDFLVHDILMTEFGDINLDGRIGNDDFGLLLGNFGAVDLGWAGGDLDGNGTVGNGDFGLVLGNFGFSAAPALARVPEPSALALALAGILAAGTMWPIRRTFRGGRNVNGRAAVPL